MTEGLTARSSELLTCRKSAIVRCHKPMLFVVTMTEIEHLKARSKSASVFKAETFSTASLRYTRACISLSSEGLSTNLKHLCLVRSCLLFGWFGQPSIFLNPFNVEEGYVSSLSIPDWSLSSSRPVKDLSRSQESSWLFSDMLSDGNPAASTHELTLDSSNIGKHECLHPNLVSSVGSWTILV